MTVLGSSRFTSFSLPGGEAPAVHLPNLIAKSAGDTDDICSGGCAVVDFFFEPVFLRLGNIVLIYPIEIMVCAVMVGVIAPKISVSVHIPCGVVVIRVKAVPDIAAGNFFVSRAPAIPKPQIGNNQNGLGKLNVQIESFVLKVVPVFLISW